MSDYQFDVLILGSGAAGLSLALELPCHMKIGIFCKGDFSDNATWKAQGGIAAVLHGSDTLDKHVEDTLKAGAYRCDEHTVRFVVERGPRAIERLQQYGVPFTSCLNDRGEKEVHLTQEGGHSHRRVAHAADTTGKAVGDHLLKTAQSRENIHIYENFIGIDLILDYERDKRCLGAWFLDTVTGNILAIAARDTALATGGASKAYLYTSNPDSSTGDGVAMAWRAGCRIANMEFMQFHPTCLYHPKARSFLLTEAIRGEGGHLLLPNGDRFMNRFDPQKELAPRDIVARAIDYEMKRTGADYVLLDIHHKPAAFIKSHFPMIYNYCLELGYDMTKEPLPVVPAAHYTCGGVKVDLHGRTDIKNLYAIGEVACSGLHGANRMASNSLLECLVFAAAAAESITQCPGDALANRPLAPWDESMVTDSDEEVVVSHNWEELRRFMWDYVGIVRTTKRLERAERRVHLLLDEIQGYYKDFRVTPDLLELRNLTLASYLIIRSALERKESIGLHHTLDYPKENPSLPHETILSPARHGFTRQEN